MKILKPLVPLVVLAAEPTMESNQEKRRREALREKKDNWFYELDKVAQDKYIEEHPNSIYAKQRKGQTKETPQEQRDEKQHPEHKQTESKQEKQNRVKKLILDYHKEQKEFFGKGGLKPESEERRTFATMLKDKAKGIAEGLKSEVKEYKIAANAMRKLKRGEKLDHHDKEAIKAIATHASIIAAEVAITGGLAHGAAYALSHFGVGMAQHSLALRFGKALVWASTVASLQTTLVMFTEIAANSDEEDDALIQELLEMMADSYQGAELSEDDMKAAFKATSKQALQKMAKAGKK